jgi:REP element-mobilizing transposase RayT
MRMARIKETGAATYHVISRVIDKRCWLNRAEKERLRCMMRAVEGFSGVKVLTYAILDSHFHILLHVPEREEITDAELLRRLRFIYEEPVVKSVAESLAATREAGDNEAAERIKRKYTYRMHDLSEFAKNLKQRFSQSYNRRHNRKGTLWVDRFKSLVVQGRRCALATVAGYIDLNAVRARLVGDPKDYRFCGYAEAVAGGAEARDGICFIIASFGHEDRWERAAVMYRQWFYEQGEQRGVGEDGRTVRSGFRPEQVRLVLESGGKLSRAELLRCRVRYFSDGVALGSRSYIEGFFGRHRARLSVRDKANARRMLGGECSDLCTLRVPRSNAVSLPTAS